MRLPLAHCSSRIISMIAISNLTPTAPSYPWEQVRAALQSNIKGDIQQLVDGRLIEPIMGVIAHHLDSLFTALPVVNGPALARLAEAIVSGRIHPQDDLIGHQQPPNGLATNGTDHHHEEGTQVPDVPQSPIRQAVVNGVLSSRLANLQLDENGGGDEEMEEEEADEAETVREAAPDGDVSVGYAPRIFLDYREQAADVTMATLDLSDASMHTACSPDQSMASLDRTRDALVAQMEDVTMHSIASTLAESRRERENEDDEEEEEVVIPLVGLTPLAHSTPIPSPVQATPHPITPEDATPAAATPQETEVETPPIDATTRPATTTTPAAAGKEHLAADAPSDSQPSPDTPDAHYESDSESPDAHHHKHSSTSADPEKMNEEEEEEEEAAPLTLAPHTQDPSFSHASPGRAHSPVEALLLVGTPVENTPETPAAPDAHSQASADPVQKEEEEQKEQAEISPLALAPPTQDSSRPSIEALPKPAVAAPADEPETPSAHSWQASQPSPDTPDAHYESDSESPNAHHHKHSSTSADPVQKEEEEQKEQAETSPLTLAPPTQDSSRPSIEALTTGTTVAASAPEKPAAPDAHSQDSVDDEEKEEREAEVPLFTLAPPAYTTPSGPSIDAPPATTSASAEQPEPADSTSDRVKRDEEEEEEEAAPLTRAPSNQETSAPRATTHAAPIEATAPVTSTAADAQSTSHEERDDEEEREETEVETPFLTQTTSIDATTTTGTPTVDATPVSPATPAGAAKETEPAVSTRDLAPPTHSTPIGRSIDGTPHLLSPIEVSPATTVTAAPTEHKTPATPPSASAQSTSHEEKMVETPFFTLASHVAPIDPPTTGGSLVNEAPPPTGTPVPAIPLLANDAQSQNCPQQSHPSPVTPEAQYVTAQETPQDCHLDSASTRDLAPSTHSTPIGSAIEATPRPLNLIEVAPATTVTAAPIEQKTPATPPSESAQSTSHEARDDEEREETEVETPFLTQTTSIDATTSPVTTTTGTPTVDATPVSPATPAATVKETEPAVSTSPAHSTPVEAPSTGGSPATPVAATPATPLTPPCDLGHSASPQQLHPSQTLHASAHETPQIRHLKRTSTSAQRRELNEDDEDKEEAAPSPLALAPATPVRPTRQARRRLQMFDTPADGLDGSGFLVSHATTPLEQLGLAEHSENPGMDGPFDNDVFPADAFDDNAGLFSYPDPDLEGHACCARPGPGAADDEDDDGIRCTAVKRMKIDLRAFREHAELVKHERFREREELKKADEMINEAFWALSNEQKLRADAEMERDYETARADALAQKAATPAPPLAPVALPAPAMQPVVQQAPAPVAVVAAAAAAPVRLRADFDALKRDLLAFLQANHRLQLQINGKGDAEIAKKWTSVTTTISKRAAAIANAAEIGLPRVTDAVLADPAQHTAIQRFVTRGLAVLRVFEALRLLGEDYGNMVIGTHAQLPRRGRRNVKVAWDDNTFGVAHNVFKSRANSHLRSVHVWATMAKSFPV